MKSRLKKISPERTYRTSMLLRPKKAPSISPERRFLCNFKERRVGRSWKVRPSTLRIWFLLKSLEKNKRKMKKNPLCLEGQTSCKRSVRRRSLQMLQVGQLEEPGRDTGDPVMAEF